MAEWHDGVEMGMKNTHIKRQTLCVFDLYGRLCVQSLRLHCDHSSSELLCV